MHVMTLIALVGWVFVCILNLWPDRKISKLSYFLVWILVITNLIAALEG